MSNPFEGVPQSEPKLPEAEEQAQLESHADAMIERIDSIQPTGDPVLDATTYDEITNKGRLKDLYTSPERALRSLVAKRESDLAMLAPQSEAEALPIRTKIRAKCSEALDRILGHYGIAETTLAEYDKRVSLHQSG